MAYDKVVDSAKLDSDLKSVADSIRAKAGTADELDFPLGFKSAVEGISTGVPINNQNKTITQNGTYTADEGFTGLGTVSVNVARDDQADIEEQWRRAIERDTSKPLTTLPSGLTQIGKNAFDSYSDLSLTSLPDGITKIRENAFKNCTSLALTSLPDSLTQIWDTAFYSCRKLALTSLPGNITKIGYQAFYGCSGLKEITFKSKPNALHNNAFSSCSNLLTINVPWAEGEVANAPWGATNATINYNYTGV